MGREIDRNRKLSDYIYNDLNSEEVAEMERELSNDPQLAESYRLNVEVKEYLQAKLQLEEMLSDPQLEEAERLADLAFSMDSTGPVVEEPKARLPKRSRTLRLTMVTALAASIALILALGILPGSLNEDDLFDRFYEIMPASDFNQRGNVQLYKDVAVGINHYRDGNYQQSIDQFSELESDPFIQPEVQLYSALSYLGLGQYSTAQNILESLSGRTSRYQAEALWYHSLSCLKTGDYLKADSLLAQLEQYDGLYQEDSQTLRRKLRRLIP